MLITLFPLAYTDKNTIINHIDISINNQLDCENLILQNVQEVWSAISRCSCQDWRL